MRPRPVLRPLHVTFAITLALGVAAPSSAEAQVPPRKHAKAGATPPPWQLASGQVSFENPVSAFENPLFAFENPLFAFENPLFAFENPLFAFENPLFAFKGDDGLKRYRGLVRAGAQLKGLEDDLGWLAKSNATAKIPAAVRARARASLAAAAKATKALAPAPGQKGSVLRKKLAPPTMKLGRDLEALAAEVGGSGFTFAKLHGKVRALHSRLRAMETQKLGMSASDAKRHRKRVAAVAYHGDLVRMSKLTEAGTTCTSCMLRLRTAAPSPITRRAVERALQASTKTRLKALADANETLTKP